MLSLNDFRKLKISNRLAVVGGAKTEAPNGGCICITEAGFEIWGAGTPNEVKWCYNKDTDAYSPDGEKTTTDYEGGRYC
ncbi:MAG TPA: hypothetical protein PLU49_13065 [Saprospiraceae bacterium]|nr:hypothetical protein [Saprospiraceae bacterium]